ncbi:MAG TPA: CpaF family protein [Tepidisphaeraceae bacterium]|jgi:pilus assembly protein CpaF|nr:CpaF family protein [Tepidisphaeraceae bacterium]
MGLFSSKHAPAAVVTPEELIPNTSAEIAEIPSPSRSMPSGLRAASAPSPLNAERSSQFDQLKVRIHQQLVQRLDVQNLRTLPPDTVRAEVRIVIRELCQSERGLLSSQDQERLMDEVMDETFGLGPLETLLKDPTITDILINRYDRIYVERRGRLEHVEVRFRDNQHLRQIIDRIVALVGRRVDETSPMVDARLADGSRVNAIIPPLALDGPAMSIRRFGAKPMQLEDLIRHGAFPAPVMDFLSAAVQARCNILISGGTGSGKTTLLNCLSRYIPQDERVVTIEDAAELQLQQPHVVRLETRPPNIEGRGEVTQRDLVKNCLRMRPDRIIIGEVRSGEALDMLQAMNTGHEGSMTTVHANTTRDALARLEVMIAMAGYDIPVRALRHQIASALQIVVQATRLTGGKRKVTRVTEITGMEGDGIQAHDIFQYEQTGVDGNGQAIGCFTVCGIRPRCCDKIESRGVPLPAELFQRRKIEATKLQP